MIPNACCGIHNVKGWLQRRPISRKYIFFPSGLQIPGGVNRSEMGASSAFDGPKKLGLARFCLNASFETILFSEGGKQIFKSHKSWRKGCVKHERHRENNKLHEKFAKLQILCTPSFLQMGSDAKTTRESSHRLFLKVPRSEHIANRTSKIYKK